jgi:hypothetical protein
MNDKPEFDVIQLSFRQRGATCCARIMLDGLAGWCWRAAQHEGDHEGALSVAGLAPSYSRGRAR